jgi:UDP-N-acetylglucosamine diphosphorylase / glucose-1-phosphate thymidylyltransferase / UDP-N-acetylgalactosamine diphosphorylase / glucosamine-1-phosphate N-acetyltransferase / galactosamine-1-phosphate N-acetyltransferase
MQAVILAAGKGARLRPITHTIPKPLIDLCGKPLIEHVLSALPEKIDEIFVVVNHLRDQIIERLGGNWNGVPIKYVVQEPLSGTAGAVHLLKDHLRGSFLVVNSDDIYQAEDLSRLVEHPLAMLFHESDSEKKSGAVVEGGRFTGLGPGNNAVCGAHVLDQSFFSIEPVKIHVSKFTELGLPQTLAVLAPSETIAAEPATFWIPVGNPDQLAQAIHHFSGQVCG